MDGHWGCPIRERWGLGPHQEINTALEEKLAFTATLAGPYADAALLADKWGCEVDDCKRHAWRLWLNSDGYHSSDQTVGLNLNGESNFKSNIA